MRRPRRHQLGQEWGRQWSTSGDPAGGCRLSQRRLFLRRCPDLRDVFLLRSGYVDDKPRQSLGQFRVLPVCDQARDSVPTADTDGSGCGQLRGITATTTRSDASMSSLLVAASYGVTAKTPVAQIADAARNSVCTPRCSSACQASGPPKDCVSGFYWPPTPMRLMSARRDSADSAGSELLTTVNP